MKLPETPSEEWIEAMAAAFRISNRKPMRERRSLLELNPIASRAAYAALREKVNK